MQPTESAFDTPALRQEVKPFRRVTALDEVQDPTANRLDPVDQLTTVTPIRPDDLQARETRFNFFKQWACAVAILNVGGENHLDYAESQRIHEQVAFDAIH